MGIIYDGYGKGKNKNEVINGVNVHRSFTIGRRTGAIWRVINYYSYAISSTLYASRLKKDYDVVFVNQLSPVMMACAGIKYKVKHNKKLVLYCLDLWPDSLCAGGVQSGGTVYNLFKKISDRIYKKADKILVTSRNFTKYFVEKFGIDENKIDYLPQYAEELFKPEPYVKSETVQLTFAGNIGAAQSVETIIRAAKLLEAENVCFKIAGDGSALEDCKKLASELQVKNLEFLGRLPVEQMPELYRKSDALLVTLSDDPLISLTLPGKIQSYMAAGKPIIGAINGETPEIIAEANCGICVRAEDSEALANGIKEFIKTDIEQAGKNAYEYYENNFKKEKFIEKLIKELENNK
jgi:glycosyltransferase involved in cell wall biosynthesis